MLLIIGTFIGGLGLFLLAVSMITDGLRFAAGDALRSILASSTRTRLRGVGSGMLVTALVQSSSAVTVATIGFVNAGLLNLSQSLGIVYGANIGTTMTGWIVAAVGFSFKVEAFALPLIGLGMITRMVRPHSRLASLGEAVAGFGLFFMGVDLLKDAFEIFSANVDVASFAPQGGLGVMLYVVLGAFMTLVTQSSSAAIAITLTAATGGVLGINAAAAMVIGANVGTTSTAALAVIGATANARRVAAAHVVFNLLTAAVALLLLPVLMWVVRSTSSVLGLQDIPAVSLAIFHTIFNILGVVLMWPITARLASFLMDRFTTTTERLSQPQYLDQNVRATPVLAMSALNLELTRVAALIGEHVAATINREGPAEPGNASRQQGLRALIDCVETFVSELEMEKLPESQKGSLLIVLRTTGYLEDVLVLLEDLDAHSADIDAIMQPAVMADIANYQSTILAQVAACDPALETFTVAGAEAGYKHLRVMWHQLKDTLLSAATARAIPIVRLNSALEGLRSYLKMAEQLTKAAERLHTLELSLNTGDLQPDKPEQEAPQQAPETAETATETQPPAPGTQT